MKLQDVKRPQYNQREQMRDCVLGTCLLETCSNFPKRMCARGMLKVLLRSRIETDKEVVMKQNGTMTWKTDREVETDPVSRDHISSRSE